MKEEIKGKEDKLERNEQVLATVQGENKKLAEPLRKAKEQVVELQRQLGKLTLWFKVSPPDGHHKV